MADFVETADGLMVPSSEGLLVPTPQGLVPAQGLMPKDYQYVRENDPHDFHFVVTMENTSFNINYGTAGEVHENLRGFDPAHPITLPSEKFGRTFEMTPVDFFKLPGFGPEHGLPNQRVQCNYQSHWDMLGYLVDFEQSYPDCTVEDLQCVMNIFKFGALPASHFFAKHFQIFDRWFCSGFGPTWDNRALIECGTTWGMEDMTAGLDNRWQWMDHAGPCLLALLAQKMEVANVYSDFPLNIVFEPVRAVADKLRQQEWALEVLSCPVSKIPRYMEFQPTWFGPLGNSDLWPADCRFGQDYMRLLFETIMANEELSERAALWIPYDEHGGYPDDVVPPVALSPDNIRTQTANNNLGQRTPMTLISRHVQPGCSNGLFENCSITRYLLEWAGFDPSVLGRRVAAANSPAYLFTDELRDDFPTKIPFPENFLPAPAPASDEHPSLHGEFAHLASDAKSLAMRDGLPAYAAVARLRHFVETRVLRHKLPARVNSAIKVAPKLGNGARAKAPTPFTD